MISNLNTYPNLQYNGIPIPAFTVVEVYKDEIVKDSSLGYFVLPIEGMDNEAIELAIRKKLRDEAPFGYGNLAIIQKGFDHKVVYAVWNRGEAPKVPDPKPIPKLDDPAEPFNVWEEIQLDNRGVGPTALTLEFDCSSFDEPIEFYINDDYYTITIEKPQMYQSIVIADETGAKYNGKNIDTFEFPTMPKIKNGSNCLRIKKTNVSKVKVKYLPKY